MATNAQTPQTYLQLISQDEKTAKVEALKLKAQEAGLALNQEIFNLTVSISKKKAEIVQLQKAIPYSVAAEYLAIKALAELEERLEFTQTVKSERFGDATI